MVVSGARHGNAKQVLVFVNRLDDRAQEQKELRVLLRSGAGVKKVLSGVGGNRPVVVLSASVHSGKGLFVQQANHSVLGGDLAHHFHRKLVVVAGDVGR